MSAEWIIGGLAVGLPVLGGAIYWGARILWCAGEIVHKTTSADARIGEVTHEIKGMRDDLHTLNSRVGSLESWRERQHGGEE